MTRAVTQKPTGKRLYLYFTGKRLWLAGGRAPTSFDAVSGTPGKYEPIPNGNYWIDPDRTHKLEWFDDLSKKVLYDAVNLRRPGTGLLGHQSAWGNYRIPIEQEAAQQQKTRRGNFFIHGGDVPGSAGCIDVGKEMDVFVGALKQEVKWANQKRIPLYVNNQYDAR